MPQILFFFVLIGTPQIFDVETIYIDYKQMKHLNENI